MCVLRIFCYLPWWWNVPGVRQRLHRDFRARARADAEPHAMAFPRAMLPRYDQSENVLGGPLPKALWKWREPRTRQTQPPATPAAAAQPAFGDAARGPLFSPTPVPGGETVQDLWPIMPPFLLCVRLLKSYEK